MATPHQALFYYVDKAERFAAEDPYVREGVVTRWRVEPWTVVT